MTQQFGSLGRRVVDETLTAATPTEQSVVDGLLRFRQGVLSTLLLKATLTAR